MSEVTKIATRVSYGNALVELAKEHDDVYVLDADLAAKSRLQVRLPCLQPDVHSSRCETLSVIRT